MYRLINHLNPFQIIFCENMTSFEYLESMSKMAIASFIHIYDEVLKEKNMEYGPSSGMELKALMEEAIFKMNKTTETEQVIVKVEDNEEEDVIEIEHRETLSKLSPRDVLAAVKKDFVFKVEGNKRSHRLNLPNLPGCIDYQGACQALCFNGGLYSPCMTRANTGSIFCKACEKKGSPITNRSDVQDKTITFGTYLEERNVPVEFVKKWINDHFGDKLIIPENEWIINDIKPKKKPRKTSKAIETSSDEESVCETVENNAVEQVNTQPENNAVEQVNTQPENNAVEQVITHVIDEMITQVVERVNTQPENNAVEQVNIQPENNAVEQVITQPENNDVDDDTVSSLSDEESNKNTKKIKMSKEEKIAKKAAKKAAKEAEKAKKRAEKAAEKEKKKAEKAAEKEKKKAEKKAARKVKDESSKIVQEVADLSDDEEDEEYDGIRMTFALNEKIYGVDNENTLYEMNGKQPTTIIGTWDDENNRPIFNNK